MGNATQEAFFNSYLQTTRSSSDDFSVNVKIPIVHMLVQVGMKAMSKKASKKTISSTKVEEQTVRRTDANSSDGYEEDVIYQDEDLQGSTADISDARSESLRSILEKLTPRQQTALHVASRWVLGGALHHLPHMRRSYHIYCRLCYTVSYQTCRRQCSSGTEASST